MKKITLSLVVLAVSSNLGSANDHKLLQSEDDLMQEITSSMVMVPYDNLSKTEAEASTDESSLFHNAKTGLVKAGGAAGWWLGYTAANITAGTIGAGVGVVGSWLTAAAVSSWVAPLAAVGVTYKCSQMVGPYLENIMAKAGENKGKQATTYAISKVEEGAAYAGNYMKQLAAASSKAMADKSVQLLAQGKDFAQAAAFYSMSSFMATAAKSSS